MAHVLFAICIYLCVLRLFRLFVMHRRQDILMTCVRSQCHVTIVPQYVIHTVYIQLQYTTRIHDMIQQAGAACVLNINRYMLIHSLVYGEHGFEISHWKTAQHHQHYDHSCCQIATVVAFHLQPLISPQFSGTISPDFPPQETSPPLFVLVWWQTTNITLTGTTPHPVLMTNCSYS